MITRVPIRVEDHLTHRAVPEFGGTVAFTGTIRSPNAGREVSSMYYDCYIDMAEQEIKRISDEARARRRLGAVEIIHRVGEVPVGEISLLVIVSAPHRREAFEACTEIVDDIKRRVPIWKKECYADDTAKWIR